MCGIHCSKECRENHWPTHFEQDGHQRFLALYQKFPILSPAPRKILRYLRVLSGYEYGQMSTAWRY